MKIKDLRFVRFGNIGSYKQHRYTANEKDMNNHHPPAKWGMYAFPEAGIFLAPVTLRILEGNASGQKTRMAS